MGVVYFQKAGRQAELAKQYSEIRMKQGVEAAIKFYKEVVAKEFPGLADCKAPESSVWWLYNADSAIKEYVSKADFSKINLRTWREFPETAIKQLSRVVGGEWSYYPEY